MNDDAAPRIGHTLEPARLAIVAAGVVRSERFDDVYASRNGAWGQARHVFLAGNGLPRSWAGRSQFVVVETGFGLGTNFLATWQAWRDDPQRPAQLHFVSLDLYPLDAAEWAAVCAAEELPADLAALRAQLIAAWPPRMPGLFRLEFEDGAVVLTLGLGDAQALAPRLVAGADAFYLDGFSPARNARMWTPALLRALARLARPGAGLATYSSAGQVRAALAALGFEVHRAPGYGAKRDMVQATYRPAWRMRRHEPPAAYGGARRALVVGGGLAGCACADALRRRGWEVELLERAAGVGAAASGLPSGLLHPLMSADDNLGARLSRAGYLYSRAQLVRLGGSALWAACGVFQQAEDEAQEALWRARFAEDPWPADFARFVEAPQAAALIGLAPRRAGIWFPGAGVAAAARWCAALVAPRRTAVSGQEEKSPPPRLQAGFDVTRIERADGAWTVFERDGRCRQAPVLILANAMDLARLHPAGRALQALGGRVSLLAPGALSGLRAGISGDGYLIPGLLGQAEIGASYEFAAFAGEAAPPDAAALAAWREDATATAAAHADHRARLAQALADAVDVRIDGAFCALRSVTADRLPLAGALLDEGQAQDLPVRRHGLHLADLPRAPGLYVLAGLGSRGLTLGPLLAELVAAQINGEPAPIEADLCAAVDPARFWLRARRNKHEATRAGPAQAVR